MRQYDMDRAKDIARRGMGIGGHAEPAAEAALAFAG
jgi:hypothetical protein